MRVDEDKLAVLHRKSGEMHKFITVVSATGDELVPCGQFNLETIESLGKLNMYIRGSVHGKRVVLTRPIC